MARLTVEDCLENVDSRYDLVLLASKRTRQITLGSDILVEENNDKPTVIALREIANVLVTPDKLYKICNYHPDEIAMDQILFTTGEPPVRS